MRRAAEKRARDCHCLEAGVRVVPAGSDVYRQGDICPAYHIVPNGWIALSVLLDDGSCQILDFCASGQRYWGFSLYLTPTTGSKSSTCRRLRLPPASRPTSIIDCKLNFALRSGRTIRQTGKRSAF